MTLNMPISLTPSVVSNADGSHTVSYTMKDSTGAVLETGNRTLDKADPITELVWLMHGIARDYYARTLSLADVQAITSLSFDHKDLV